jgi:5-formyltetrahydrofolate cyclo-ligase
MPFDPDVVAALRIQAKAQIRKRMRALRNAIPDSAIQQRSARICDLVAGTSVYREARQIALFAPMLARHEVDVRGLDAESRRRGKSVLYPRLEEQAGVMSLRYAAPEELKDLGNRFAEPPPDARVGHASNDLLIVVPALAVGPDGHRIGYGGGYYDRLLAQMAPPASTMTVAFDFQLLAEIPFTTYDRPVDCVVTDAGVRQVGHQG